MEGLLDGVVVLDLGRVLACPYAATLLADMGATVIKIENPKGGDDTRKMGPFVNGNSVYYANFNRGKIGVTLNLKEPEGKEIFKEMVKKADVVLENYRPGTMEKLGLGYDVLKEVNPGIVYGAVSGFGHTGPLSKRAGYDIVGQAMGGLMSTSGWPNSPATRSGTPMGDVLGALNMTVGVLAALVNKQKTGLGEKVDVALVEGVPEEKILKIKKEEISTKIARFISHQGFKPRVFRETLLAALQLLWEYVRKLGIPSKPKLGIDMKEFYEMENLKSKLDQKLRVIRQAEQVELPRLEKDLKDITGFFKGKEKKEAPNKIDQCKERIRKQKDELHILVKKSGYPNVQKFMDGYRTAYKIVEQYKKELEIWKQKTGQNDIQPERKKSVLERLKENEKRVKERGRPKSVNKQKRHDWLDR